MPEVRGHPFARAFRDKRVRKTSLAMASHAALQQGRYGVMKSNSEFLPYRKIAWVPDPPTLVKEALYCRKSCFVFIFVGPRLTTLGARPELESRVRSLTD